MKHLVLLVLLIVLVSSCCSGHTPARYAHQNYVEVLNDSTVALLVDDDGEWAVSCSGFFITQTLLVTASHCVISDEEELEMKLGFSLNPFGRATSFATFGQLKETQPHKLESVSRAMLIAWDTDNDLALLHAADAPLHSSLRLSDRAPTQGDNVFSIGHTAALPYSLHPGVVSAIRTLHLDVFNPDKEFRLVQVASGAWSGSSGSAVVNMDGEVVGVCRSVHAFAPIMTFFVDLLPLRDFLRDHKVAY